MAALAYSIQSPVRSCTIPSSKIQLCCSYGCFAIAPKPAEEKGLLWSSQTKTGFLPKSSSLCFRLNGSSMGFRKCSFSSCAKGGDGDVDSVRVTNDFIFVGSMVAVTAFAAKYISPAWRTIFFISSGVAIVFAARDLLRNLESWLYLQRSQPFSLGDTIKVVSLEGKVYVEGKVVEMGLITTLLLSEHILPIIVPNSLFSSQAILNLSRGRDIVTTMRFHSDDNAKAILNLSQPHGRRMVTRIVTTIRLYIDDLSKAPLICKDIEKMLNSNPMIFLEKKKPPYCHLSKILGGDSVFTLGFTLKEMRKGAFYSARQNIIVQAADLIKRHGATFISWISVKSEHAFYEAQKDILVQADDLIKRHGATFISWI